MWLLLVMLAAPADAGPDLSDEEFAKTFGRRWTFPKHTVPTEPVVFPFKL